jgi:uncharacterized membrane protein YfcA
MNALGVALAVLVGLSLGLLGSGGSVLTVPIFVYVLGFAAKPAIAMSLPVVGATSLIGALGHARAGNVNLSVALVFGGIAMVGSYAGARGAALVPGGVQLLLLGAVMLAAAASMLRQSLRTGRIEDRTPSLGARRSPWLVALAGFGVGMLTGLVGIGGGFLIVPALVLLARVPMRQAVGTSLAVITMNSAAGLLGYLGAVEIAWGVLAQFVAVAASGVLAGASLGRSLSAVALKRVFAVFLLVVGALMLYQNRAALSARPAASLSEAMARNPSSGDPGSVSVRIATSC